MKIAGCVALWAYFATSVEGKKLKPPSPHVPCRPMKEYMPQNATRDYNISKHNGTWYEASFRDLYPWGPICDCQQSIKYVNEKEGYIDDYFVFSCGLDGFMHFISPQRENRTNASSGELHENGVFDMYVRHSDFKFITHYEWNSEMIGFKDDGQDQYEWVIEFQCGTRPGLPPEVCLDQTVNGECYFTGVQFYVRDLDNVEQGREEMVAYLKSLGPETSKSLAVDWVMDDFGAGTFPGWFKNVTEKDKSGVDKCPRPCASGVFNETTGMWGCPPEHHKFPKDWPAEWKKFW